MTPYYFLAVGFGLISAAIAAYGIWVRKDFPSGSIVPVVAFAMLLFVGTLTAAIAGGIAESGEHDEEAGTGHAAQTAAR